jgi:hypothetical protein
MFAVINCTRLKYKFSITTIIYFRGTHLWLRVCLGSVISLVIVGDIHYWFFMRKEMVRSSKIKINKFNGKNFELWKLKMQDLLVYKDQLIVVDSSISLTGTPVDDWKKLY